MDNREPVLQLRSELDSAMVLLSIMLIASTSAKALVLAAAPSDATRITPFAPFLSRPVCIKRVLKEVSTVEKLLLLR